ncbi:glycosyltransferase family 2 protein [Chitinophaga varians]|uniref:glycosyltransferase family 2 protein n=1 Tax=Chitinophaga varians TaxID=2202339 RepID=UPI00165F9394|nr:glycosyltransferase [Chitinophaga varians]MBC9913347.1 glycosyltransferase [Chitinophaga varians]
MIKPNAIDIVVPSFRLTAALLLNIIRLEKPAGFEVNTFIVADNPAAVIPETLKELDRTGEIHLLVNETNLGFSGTRNKGIRAGQAKWVLLLDDDIVPQPDLLKAYATAISQNDQALGFAGVTYFPEAINAATRALEINGSVHHFKLALYYPEITWAPTTNMMINREKLDPALFDTNLKEGGEDVDFFVRHWLKFNEKYQSVPAAAVTHPWHDNGAMQTRRQFRYGMAANQLAHKEPEQRYTYRDFTNTLETLLLLLFLFPAALFTGTVKLWICLVVAVPLAEYLTNWFKAITVGKTWSPAVAFQLMWAKNCWEAGYLYDALLRGRPDGFAKRIDMGFAKENPSSFRTNRWKIVKIVLLVILVVIAVCTIGNPFV